VEVWPKDWSIVWARRSVGSPFRLTLAIASVILLVILEFAWPRIFDHASVILGSVLILAYFSMYGLYKRYMKSVSP
jgi:hypothetical protein